MLFINHKLSYLRYLTLTLIGMAMISLSGGVAVNATSPAQTQVPPQSTPTPRPILLTDPVPDPHQAGVQWFAPTGHTLRGTFLDYWTKYGGLAQFGYPLTEEFFEPVGPNNELYQVQYFERNSFEHHPEYAGIQYEVLLGALGNSFHGRDTLAAPLPDAMYFRETGHNLSGVFRQYWETHGGLFVHGYPITEPFQETNPIDKKTYTVQYFERSRFEHHPENAGTQYEVLLGLLGVQLSEKNGFPYGWYPSYGYASDYSWIAGRFIYPLRACYGCACDNVHYVPNASERDKGANVLPIGPVWDAASRAGQIHAFTMAIVIFGHLVDSGGERGLPCYMPKYMVNTIQANPAR